MVAVAKGHPNSRWIAAATLDRYLMAAGQSQVFGTQYTTRAYAERPRQEGEHGNPSASVQPRNSVAAAVSSPTTNSYELYKNLTTAT
jgi:hypothetical protein